MNRVWVYSLFFLGLGACSNIGYFFGANSTGKGNARSKSSSSSSKINSSKIKIGTTTGAQTNNSNNQNSYAPPDISTPEKERAYFGTINGEDLVTLMTTRRPGGKDFEPANCNSSNATTISLPSDFSSWNDNNSSFTLPGGCIKASGEVYVNEGSTLYLYTGSKLVDTVVRVRGKFHIYGSPYRNVELLNVNIIPSGGTQQVYMRWAKTQGGYIYPNQAGSNYSKAKLLIRNSEISGMAQPIHIGEAAEYIEICYNKFINSAAIEMANTGAYSVDVLYNIFSGTTPSGYSLIYLAQPPLNATYPNHWGSVQTWSWRNFVGHNDFSGVTTAVRLNFPNTPNYTKGNEELFRGLGNLYSNYWGPGLDSYDEIVGAIGKKVVGELRRANSMGTSECYLNCPHWLSNLTRPHDLITDFKFNYNQMMPLTPTPAPDGTLSNNGNTLTLEEGEEYFYNYDAKPDFQFPAVVVIPENTYLTIWGPSHIRNTEFQVYGGLKIGGAAGDKRQNYLENVTIRGMKTDKKKYSYGHRIQIENVYMRGGALYPYERFTFPEGTLEVRSSTFEGLELPIFVHGSQVYFTFSGNELLRSMPLIAGSWNTSSSHDLLSSHFSESKIGTHLIYPNLPNYIGKNPNFKNEYERNNFFVSSGQKAISFNDKLATNREPELFKNCYWHNPSSGRGYNEAGVLANSVRGPNPAPLSFSNNRSTAVILGEETETSREQYKFLGN